MPGVTSDRKHRYPLAALLDEHQEVDGEWGIYLFIYLPFHLCLNILILLVRRLQLDTRLMK